MRRCFNAVYVLLLLMICMSAAAQEDLKQDAVRRVVSAHDPALVIATGALYVTQVASRAALGRVLSGPTKARVQRVIEARLRDPSWFFAGWAQAIDRHLSAEEADEIAMHFGTEGGKLQRRVIELAVAEVVLTNYTFTDRIHYGDVNAREEMQALQHALNARAFHGVQDFSGYPDAVKFASSGAGVKYVKMLMIQGVEAITKHFDEVAQEVRGQVSAESAGPEPR